MAKHYVHSTKQKQRKFRQTDWATKWIACSDILIIFVLAHDARIQFIHQMNGKFEIILTTRNTDSEQ